MSFLPTDYEVPESSGGKYLKFAKGDNRLRILSDTIVGWLYWTTENKSCRLKKRPESTPGDIRINDNGKPDKIKHFWAMVVWDYKDNGIKILEVTQSSIQGQIMALYEDADWGHPRGYDLKIKRTGEGLDTEYNVTPGKASDIPSEAIAAFEGTPINLMALYEGKDPFDATVHSHPLETMPPGWASYCDMLSRATSDEQIQKARAWALNKMPDIDSMIEKAYMEALDKLSGDEDPTEEEPDYEDIPF